MTNTETNTLPVWLVVAIWAVIALVLNIIGVFSNPDRTPLDLLIAIIGPPILFAFAYSLSKKVRTLSLSLDLRLLTAMQGWRIVGVMFLSSCRWAYCLALLHGPQGSAISLWVRMLHLWFLLYRDKLRVGKNMLCCSTF